MIFLQSNLKSSFKGAGKDVGLDVLLSPSQDQFDPYLKLDYGIKVSIHRQEEYSDINNLITVKPGYDLRIFVSPHMISSGQSVVLFFRRFLEPF